MYRRLFFEIQIFITDKRTEQKPIAHRIRNVPERILLDVQFVTQKAKHEFRRFVFLDLDFEILLERFLRRVHAGNPGVIHFGRERIKLFFVLARERPQ